MEQRTHVEVPLTQGLVALVDEVDADAVLAHRWHAHRDTRNNFYALRSVRRPDGKQATLPLHTFLTGWPLVDHRNGDGLDNRRSNLRAATNAENQRNRGLPANNTSGYKGVTWNKPAGKWQAGIRVDGRLLALGRYTDPEAAARAYDAAALLHFGEFAWLNFPDVQ